jgi:hypothetical protein
LGSGRAVVGQALSADLTRAEVLDILTTGFLPIAASDEILVPGRSTGLRELGLPYASDPAITKHLAAFLTQAAALVRNVSSSNPRMARPDAVLFNGGFCAPVITRDRIVDAIANWFGGAQSGWRPMVIHNEALDSAVARGAAYYGSVRHGAGLRIRAGCARTYYIGLPSNSGLQAICVLPAGAEEGTTLPLLTRDFSLLANRPVSFALYSSRTRYAAHGEVAILDDAEVHRHPPLVTLLRYGKKMRDVYLTIGLRASFTEVGTLEVWCESRATSHRWRLQFELRDEEAQAENLDIVKSRLAVRSSPVVSASDAKLEAAAQLIGRTFGSAKISTLPPDALVSSMESALEAKKDSWPISAIRRFSNVLMEFTAGRNNSPGHEMRWLNLSGFCLRPGFGVTGDDARVSKLLAITSNLAFFDDLQCQVAALVLLRRIAGGVDASQQQTLYRKYASASGSKNKRGNRQLEYEKWRLLASLEHMLGGTRALLGNEVLAKIKKEPGDAMWLWSLGRLGTRIPLYGPLHSVVTAEIAKEWLKKLLALSTFTEATASAMVLVARRTDDRSRDIDEVIRELTISRLVALGIGEETVQRLSKYVPPERADAVRSFGEPLPPGLQLVSSSNCLLSVPAFHSS